MRQALRCATQVIGDLSAAMFRPCLIRDIATRIIDQIIAIIGSDYPNNLELIIWILEQIIDYITTETTSK